MAISTNMEIALFYVHQSMPYTSMKYINWMWFIYGCSFVQRFVFFFVINLFLSRRCIRLFYEFLHNRRSNRIEIGGTSSKISKIYPLAGCMSTKRNLTSECEASIKCNRIVFHEKWVGITFVNGVQTICNEVGVSGIVRTKQKC